MKAKQSSDVGARTYNGRMRVTGSVLFCGVSTITDGLKRGSQRGCLLEDPVVSPSFNDLGGSTDRKERDSRPFS